MKIIINTSNLYSGGGLQVALSFINELKGLFFHHEYHIFMSLSVSEQIDIKSFQDNFKFYIIERSPSSLKTRLQVVSKMSKLEKEIKPEIVFSVFGPSYWRPKAPHIIGFADGWLYNPTSVAYEKVSFIKKFKIRLLNIYKSYYLKHDADYFVLETKDAKSKFVNILKLNANKVFVVGNTYSSVFNDDVYRNEENEFYIKLPIKKENEFRFMYIAHNHPAKNLNIINDVYKYLKNKNITFVLTIDEVSYNILFKDKKYIINVGPIKQKSCPSIYKQCDALFAPTLLETFSAAYPESMKMNIPILTSNYSFATTICEEAALYFNPLNPEDIANKINLLIKDSSLREKLISNGHKQLKKYEIAKSRAKKYIELCEKIVKKNSY